MCSNKDPTQPKIREGGREGGRERERERERKKEKKENRRKTRLEQGLLFFSIKKKKRTKIRVQNDFYR